MSSPLLPLSAVNEAEQSCLTRCLSAGCTAFDNLSCCNKMICIFLSFTALGTPLVCTSKNGSAQAIAGVSLILAPWVILTIYNILLIAWGIFQCACCFIDCCRQGSDHPFWGDSLSTSLYTTNFPISYQPITTHPPHTHPGNSNKLLQQSAQRRLDSAPQLQVAHQHAQQQQQIYHHQQQQQQRQLQTYVMKHHNKH